MFVLRLATRSRKQAAVVRARLMTATDPASPGGTAILPCEMPDVWDAVDGQEALATVVDINGARDRAFSPQQVDALNREFDAWLPRIPDYRPEAA